MPPCPINNVGSLTYIINCISKGKQLYLSLLFIFSLFATSSQEKVFLPLTKLETKDGLSSPNVRTIVQDKFGFMWFATQDGLNRFDGISFNRYTSSSSLPKYSILESDVYDIALDEASDKLWCLTAYGGLSKVDLITGIVVQTFPLPVHPINKNKLWFRCMSMKKNHIYIGTNEGYVILFNTLSGKTEKIIYINSSSPGKKTIDRIFIDDSEQVWLMLSDQGIKVFDQGLSTQLVYLDSKHLLSTNITSLKFTGYVKINDKLLISTDAGLVEINIKDKAVILQEHNDYNIPSYLYRSNIHCISTSTEKILFSGDRGLYSINKKDKRIQQIQFSKNYDDRKWLTLTNCIFQTHDNIWIGSQYGVGWLKNLNSSFTGYYNSMDGNGIMIEHSITLFNINDSVIGICGDDGLYFSNHLSGKISKYSVTDFYYHAFKLPDGNILASGENKKIQIIDNSGDSIELTKTYPELKEIRNDLLMSSAFLDDSICFMASQNEKGIYIWNLKTKKITILNTTSGPVSLKSPIINRLFIDSQKRLWIVGDNTISIYNHYKRQVSHLNLLNPRNNDPLSINMDICEAGGKFWIATYGTGIIELSGSGNINRIYSAADGINNLGLYKIFKLSDSALIVSSNSGLSLLNFKTGKVTNYFDEAGLNSNNFEESSGCENEKYIFLGGLRGYTKIDKRKLSIQTSFNNLYFSSSLVYQPDKITDTSNLFLQQIKVPGNYVQVVVNFNYLNYASPEKTKFQYRLKGINNSWTPTDTKKSISLSSTPPGTYQLQLQASNEAGDWSDPVELTLIFLPKWYQTFWFRSILAILFIGSIYGLYRIRINQIKKEQKIRSKLASDIHDDLGSTLNSVKVYANLALMDKDKDKYLHKVKENIQEALTGVKDIIWVLDDSKDTVEYLLSRVNQFAAPICEANGINYKQKMSDDVRDYKLLRAEKRNLYMILKEAVNNACKYAGASDLSIEVGLQKKRPVLIISDSGKGFDETFIQEGNGLKNMQIRSKEIKYQLIIQSSHSKGTFIQLKKI